MLADLLRLQLDFLGARAEMAVGVLGGGLLRRIAPFTAKKLPVLTIPGFLASDDSLLRMNRFLTQRGFVARSWGLGRNLGPQGKSWNAHLDSIGHMLARRINSLADETSEPVALIGQSLGGVYARELALRLEGRVDRVIMLGAPTFHPYKTHRHNQVVGAFASFLNRRSESELAGREGMLHWDADHPALPCVAIHSPIDGVVDEDACHIPGYIVQASGGHSPRENIRVLASHIGMSVSPWVLLAVADRLLANRGHWQVFDPKSYFPACLAGAVQVMYPSARSLVTGRGPVQFVEQNP